MEITIGLIALAVFTLCAAFWLDKGRQELAKQVEKLSHEAEFKRREEGAAKARAYAEERLARWRNAGHVPDLAEFETVARHWHVLYHNDDEWFGR